MESLIPLDYATLRVIWWILLGTLLVGFAIMDGFDVGVAALLPFVAKGDAERRVVINVVGPVWEGNQVWLLTGGGAIFAAWPLLYAASFSGFYLAMLLILLALILRPVGFKYRSKYEGEKWRSTWDWLLCFSGVVIALVCGVAMGNVILGVPHGFDPDTMRPVYTGWFIQLFMPFALLAGVLSVTLLMMHGAVLLAWRTDGAVAGRARAWARVTALLTVVLFVLGGVWVNYGVDGQVLTSAFNGLAPTNPLGKTVEIHAGAWMNNFHQWPLFWIAPALGVAGALLVLLAPARRALSFIFSSISIAGVIFTVGFALFPFLLPSSSQPNAGLTIWDASSSHMTLWIMLVAVVIFLPIIIAYTSWVYHVMRGKVTTDTVNGTPNSY